jgi:hypothetical protein
MKVPECTSGTFFLKIRETHHRASLPGDEDMIPVFYPYWENGSKWEELRYSLRSLESHFKTDFIVYVVGDRPEWIQNVIHIPYEREVIDQEPSLHNALMMLHKFLITRITNDELHELRTNYTKPPTGFGTAVGAQDLFVRMYDDIYFLKDRTVEDLMVTRIVRTKEEAKAITAGGGKWRQQVKDACGLLERKGYDGYMTETHCPEVFSARLMRHIFRMFDLPKNKLLTSTIYYNVFPYKNGLVDKKTERALFYGEDTAYSYLSRNIESTCEGKYFLNHNDAGLNEELKEFIKGRFTEKSRFEK